MLSLRNILLSAGLLSCVSLAQAVPITLKADHFSITYDDAAVGLYKQGLLSGSLDTVYFRPNTFRALSGGAATSTPASLQLTLTVDPGYAFSGLTYTGRGDYFLFGSGAVDVAASVRAVNAATAGSAILNLGSGMPLTPSGNSTPWELTGDLSLSSLGTPQTLLITLDNELFASASNGGLGFIQKTYVGFRVATEAVAVPEPTSGGLFLAAAIAALLAGRRRQGPVSGRRALDGGVR